MIAWLKRQWQEHEKLKLARELFASIETNDRGEFERLLSDFRDLDEFQESACSLLSFCSSEVSDPFFLESLLKAGLDPNRSNQDGIFPLHIAVENGRVEEVRILLENGADPDVGDPNGVTPLHISYSYDGLAEISDLLLSHGADPNKRDKLGKRYLM